MRGNVASRLEKATKEVGSWFVCSRAAWEDAHRAGSRPPALPMVAFGSLALRGVGAGLEVYAATEQPAARSRSLVA